jgi:haloalkane dehalogenase
MNNFKFAAAFALLASNAAFADPSVYTPALSMDSNFTRLEDGTRIHSIEAGTGHTVVLLHGLPASAYLWRDVVPLVGQSNHAVAPDLPGYGYSSTLATGDFDLSSAADALAEYLDGISAEKITLVVTDMGSVLGLNYAIKNPERIAGIVMSEAVFQPPEAFMAQIRPEHLEFIMAAQDPAFVKQITLDQPMLVDMAMQNNSVTELSEETLSNYRSPYYAPFEDHQEKRQTLNAVFGADGLQDFGVIAAKNAVGLAEMDVPILLVVANPGYMVNAPAVAYARDTFANLTVKEIEGAGHFFAEDNPEGFSEVVNEWLAEVKN